MSTRFWGCLLVIAGCGAPQLPEGLPPPEYERRAPEPSTAWPGGAPGGAAGSPRISPSDTGVSGAAEAPSHGGSAAVPSFGGSMPSFGGSGGSAAASSLGGGAGSPP